MKLKCIQHGRNIIVQETNIIHTDGTLCYSRLLSTPYDNKEPENEG